MALRIMVYTGLLYQDLIKIGEVRRGEKLPAVFPLLLYNGRERWHVAHDVGDLIEWLPSSIKHYQTAHRYFLLEEGAVSENCHSPARLSASAASILAGTMIKASTLLLNGF